MKVKLTLSDESLARVREHPELMQPAIFKGMTKGMFRIEGRTKSHYLSGEALNRRTGRLRNSIVTEVEQHGDRISGVISTNVSYGRFWELGYDGIQIVDAHERRITKAWGRSIAPKTVDVTMHAREVKVDARSFMQPSIEDERDKVLADIEASIEAAYR